jgi:hypothetical protein
MYRSFIESTSSKPKPQHNVWSFQTYEFLVRRSPLVNFPPSFPHLLYLLFNPLTAAQENPMAALKISKSTTTEAATSS